MTLQKTRDDSKEQETVVQRALSSMLEWQLLENMGYFPFSWEGI